MSYNRPRNVKTYQVTVAAAGTAVNVNASGQIPANTFAMQFYNPQSNTGDIYVGNDGADDVSSATGRTLEKGESISFDLFFDDSVAAPIWVDAATNGDKVEIICLYK